MLAPGAQESEQAHPREQWRPAIAETLPQRESLTPRKACEQPQGRKHGGGSADCAMRGRRDQHVHVVAERARPDDAGPGEPRTEYSARQATDADAEEQIAEQVRLIQMQGQRRYRAPPLAAAAGTRVQRARGQPVDSEQLNSGAIRREQQHRPIDHRAGRSAFERDDRRGLFARNAALRRIACEFLACAAEDRRLHEHAPPAIEFD